MKQIRWKLLIRYLFSELRLRKREVKLRLMSPRLEVLGQNVGLGDVEEPVDQSTADLECVDVAPEKLVALENLNDLPTVLFDEGLVASAEHVEHLGRFLDDDFLEPRPRFQRPENPFEESGLVRSPETN